MRQYALILILLCAPATAGAETGRRNLWITLGLLPVAYFHETTLHEAAHLAVAKAAVPGLEVTRFAPYPCRDSKGNFHFGCFGSRYPEGTQVSDGTRNAIAIAPYVLGAFTFTVSDILLSTRAVKPKSVAGAVVYTLGMLAPFIDFAANYALNRSDWDGIRSRSRGPAFDIVGGAMLLVGTYRLVRQGYEVLGR